MFPPTLSFLLGHLASGGTTLLQQEGETCTRLLDPLPRKPPRARQPSPHKAETLGQDAFVQPWCESCRPSRSSDKGPEPSTLKPAPSGTPLLPPQNPIVPGPPTEPPALGLKKAVCPEVLPRPPRLKLFTILKVSICRHCRGAPQVGAHEVCSGQPFIACRQMGWVPLSQSTLHLDPKTNPTLGQTLRPHTQPHT